MAGCAAADISEILNADAVHTGYQFRQPGVKPGFLFYVKPGLICRNARHPILDQIAVRIYLIIPAVLNQPGTGNAVLR